MSEQIIQSNVVSQYKIDMARYSIEANRRRAFPDYKDGFKLCHRRILYVMAFDMACRTRLVKTAQVVGKTMGDYHPHGDTSIKDAITPMANWYSTYIPLVYSESNMGSMQGDGAAASRYTEVMLSEFAKEAIFNEMWQTPNIVDWVPTYTGNSKEPESLPVAVPLLLINGTSGIGLGKATSIPPHNINEVIDATLKLIDNPNAKVVLVPDQCMPCEIIEANWKQISNSGNGKFKVRSIVDIEICDKGKANEHYCLVVKSIADSVIIDNGKGKGIIYQINELIEKGRLPQITGITEDSHEKDMRIVIHLKKGSDPEYVREYLFKATRLQVTQTVNFEVLDGIQPLRMSYKSYLQAFIKENEVAKFRKYCIQLQDARTQLHEKEICIKVIESGKIDTIIKRIRSSKLKNDTELIEWLIKLLDITDLQAKFIINYPLKKLAPAYLNDYKKDAKKFREIESHCMSMIMDNTKILQEIKDQLLYFKQKYGCPRRCKVLSLNEISNIPQGTFNVVITENNFIKKLPANEPIGSYKGDRPVNVIRIENTSDLILITTTGRMFRIPVHKIPVSEKNSVGMDIRIMIKGISSGVVKIFDYEVVKQLADLKKKSYAVIVTKNNFIKKLDLDDLLVATKSGIIMTKLNNGDEVRDVEIIPNDLDVVIYSDRKALRCSMKSIPNYKRNTIGVYAMNTKDELYGISAIDPSITDIVALTKSGKINKFNVSGLALSDRYKSGNSVIKLGKTDSIYKLFGTKDNDILHVITKNNITDINVQDIPRTSSISSGTKMINLKGDNIVNASLIY